MIFSFAGFCLTTIPFVWWTMEYFIEADWSTKNPLFIFPWGWLISFGDDMKGPVPHFVFHLVYSLMCWHHVIIAERGEKFAMKFCWSNLLGCLAGQDFILPLTTQAISPKEKIARTDDKKKVGSSWQVHLYQLHTALAIQAIRHAEGNYLGLLVGMYALIAPVCFGIAVEGKIITVPGLYKFLWGIASICTILHSLWNAIIWADWSISNFLEAGMKNWASFCLMFDGIILLIFGVYTLAFESQYRKFKPV